MLFRSGDLPEGLRVLRPFMFMGDLVVHHPLTKTRSSAPNRLSHNLGVYYSFSYKGTPGFLRRFYPMIEWKVEREANGDNSGRKEVFVIPGIQWMGRSMQFGAGVILPANSRAREGADYGVIGMIGFFDEFYPPFLRGPILDRFN